MRWTRGRSVLVGAFVMAFALAMGLAVGFGGGANAQDMKMSGVGHPAHVHEGLCPTPGKVVYPLSDVSSAMLSNGTPTAGSMMGAKGAIPVEFSTTKIATNLAGIVDGNHSIVVHESMANIGNYIACGDLGGMMMGSSDLAVGLGTLNKSGYSGVAWLHDDGDGSTTVTIYLTGGNAMSAGATPMAGTPAAGASPVANGAAVEIKGFAFNQASLDISSGTTVTWTNHDSVPHTVTQDGGGFASKPLNPGDTFSFTFTTAGTFTYHCEFHANMKGTITVK